MLLNSITGILSEKNPDGYACCDVRGVEWLFLMSQKSLSALPELGSGVRIFTHLKVSENAIALYGFTSREERSLFEALITVPGIGPKVALGMLSKAETKDIVARILQGDADSLARLPGLGNKTAQKVILQLSDNIARLASDSALEQASKSFEQEEQEELRKALCNMGYEPKACTEVLDRLFAKWNNSSMPAEGERMRQAIMLLGT